MSFRPRRSVLYMPGSNARAIEKARTLPADCIVLDLEDSVAPEAKAAARVQAGEAVKAGGFGPREVVVRINGLDTAWWLDDVNVVAPANPDALLIPKVSSPDHLEQVAERLVDMSADHRIRVWAMMETPLAMLNASAIAAVATIPAPLAAPTMNRLRVTVSPSNAPASLATASQIPRSGSPWFSRRWAVTSKTRFRKSTCSSAGLVNAPRTSTA